MRVFQTFNRNEASRVVHITQDKGKADLCVYIVGNRGLAFDDSRWFLVNSKADADATFYYGSVGSASLIVCFVKSPAQAGWQKSHALQGRLRSF